MFIHTEGKFKVTSTTTDIFFGRWGKKKDNLKAIRLLLYIEVEAEEGLKLDEDKTL